MANVAKFTRQSAGSLLSHYERAKNSDGEYVRFGNQEIRTERSHLNYNLAPEHNVSLQEFLRLRLSQVKCLKRSDVNVMCSWVITLPKGMAYLDDEAVMKRFFEVTYGFLSKLYGEENVISSYVHRDETTPHMHFAFVPVVRDVKKGHLKVSAKELINRDHLTGFHEALDAELSRVMGPEYTGGIITGATKEGNRAIRELKRDGAKAELEELRRETLASVTDEATIIIAEAQFTASRHYWETDKRLSQERDRMLDKAREEVESILETANENAERVRINAEIDSLRILEEAKSMVDSMHMVQQQLESEIAKLREEIEELRNEKKKLHEIPPRSYLQDAREHLYQAFEEAYDWLRNSSSFLVIRKINQLSELFDTWKENWNSFMELPIALKLGEGIRSFDSPSYSFTSPEEYEQKKIQELLPLYEIYSQQLRLHPPEVVALEHQRTRNPDKEMN